MPKRKLPQVTDDELGRQTTTVWDAMLQSGRTGDPDVVIKAVKSLHDRYGPLNALYVVGYTLFELGSRIAVVEKHADEVLNDDQHS